MDAVDRIFNLVDVKYTEQRQFAHDLGIPPSVVSEWRRRRSASYTKRLPEIAAILETTPNFLLSGEKKEPTITTDGGQVQKLVDELNKLGIDVERLSEGDIRKLAKLAKTYFED